MKMRKIIAVIAAALMLFSILPIAAFAAEDVTINTYAKTGTLSGTTSISWESGDYQVVSYKNTSSTAIRTSDTDHFRYYVGNKLVISGKDGALMSKVVITCTGSSYMLNNASNTLGAGWTVSASSSTTLTYTPAGGSASELTITIGKQSRSSKIVITPAAAAEPEEPSTCEHVWVDANCTTPKTCSACGATEGEALGHTYGEATETVAPDCTNAGEKQSTCSVCGDVKTEAVKALGHTYVDGFCSVCGEAEPLEVTITFDNTSKRTTSTTSQQVWEENGIVVTYDKNTYTNNLADYSNPIRFYAGTKVTVSYPNITKVEIVANTAAYATTLSNSITGSTADGKVVTYVLSEAADSVSFVPSAQVRVDSITVYFEAPAASDCEHDYVGVETQAPTCAAEGMMTYTCSKCQESYTEAIAVIPHNYVEDIIDSTCTATGTKTYECSVCGNSYDETIPMKDHDYVDDVCADCGHVKAYKGTLVFDADKENRTEYTTQIQVWEQNGVKLTNNKASSTTNIGDYAGRFYKNSQIIIEFSEKMSTLIIDATDVDDDKLWDDTLTNAGLSFTVEDKIYTITFAEPVNSIELTAANQVRANSITAIVAHECTYDSVVTDPDCVNGGYTTNTCTKCGDSNVSDTTEALGHTYDHAYDVDCNVCGAIREVNLPIVSAGTSVSEDVNGVAVKFAVSVEGLAVVEGSGNVADYTNASIDGNKLISMGVVASNQWSSTDIPCVYLCDLDETSAAYATRIINIPDGFLDSEITFQSYFVVEIDGVETTVYADSVSTSYNNASPAN